MTTIKMNHILNLKVFLTLFAFLLSPIAHAVVPYNGDEFTYYQPNGEAVKVKLYGNNHYAIAETLEGYTIIRDPKTKAFSYAKLSADKNSLLSTGIRIKGNKKNALSKNDIDNLKKIPKKIRISNHAFRANCEQCRIKIGATDWNKKYKKMLQARREKLKKINPLTPSTLQTSQAANPTNTQNTTKNSAPKINTTLNSNSQTGTRTTLVLLAQFPDRPQDVVHSTSTINDHFNAIPYSRFGNATSVKGYFKIQSNNQLEVNSIVTAYFTASKPRSHYTHELPHTIGARELIKEGLDVLQANGFDFSQLDGDNNGIVDTVSLLYAGSLVNAWGEGLWPHASSVIWTGFENHGLNFATTYQVTNISQSETNTDLSIGTICHEYGHALLNLPDLYSYNANASSPGRFCLMSYTNNFHPNNISAPLKIGLGWGTVTQASGNTEQTFTLQADNNTFVKYTNPNDQREYFIAEMRGSSYEAGPYGGNNKAVFPDRGLALYHIKENGSNNSSSIFTANNPNTNYSTPYYLLPLEKNYPLHINPWYDDPNGNPNDVFINGDVVTSHGTPGLKFWSQTGRTISSGIDIYDINVLDSSLSFKIGKRFSTDNTPPSPNTMTWESPPTTGFTPQILHSNTLANNNPDTNQPWKESDFYRLIFTTSQKTAATSNNIEFYNSFVQNLANNSTLELSNFSWKVIGSTSQINAKENTSTHPSLNNNGVPIYLVDGETLIAKNHTDLWDGSINAPINTDENGAPIQIFAVATGTNSDGTKRDNHLGGNNDVTPQVDFGNSNATTAEWIAVFNFPAITKFQYYALSDPIPASTYPSFAKMTATTASDPTNVEYYFSETSGNPGGDDSGWQDSPTYTDYGLTYGLQYTYTVKARDKSINQNETIPSAAVSVIPQPRTYNEWASSTFPSGNKLTNTNQTLDSDNGGLISVLEWVLAGDPTNKNDDLTIMPTFGHTPNSGNFTYRRNDAAHTDPNTTIIVEYSSDLKTWQTATQGQFINITESNDAFGPGIDKVTLQFSDNITQNKDLFVRLKATVTQ